MRPKIGEIEAFLTVIDEGGFSAAAKTLGITQSAVSLRVKSLEEMLGAQLITRRGRTPELTPQGAALADHGRQILELIEATPSLIGGAIAGQLTVGAVPTVLFGLLPRALAGLRETYPNLRLNIRGDSSSGLAQGLSTGASDVVVATEPPRPVDGMRFDAIAKEPIMALVPRSLADTGVTFEALLATTPYIWFNRNSWAGGLIETRLNHTGIKVPAMMEMDSLEAVVSMVAAGLGISIAPIAIAGLPVPRTVSVMPFEDGGFYRTVGVLYREDHMKMRLIAALADALRTAADGKSDVMVLQAE